MSERQAKYLESIKLRYRGIVERALAGAASPRQAIKAKCITCCDGERDEVRFCTVTICPLHTYRPWQGNVDAGVGFDAEGEANEEDLDPVATTLPAQTENAPENALEGAK